MVAVKKIMFEPRNPMAGVFKIARWEMKKSLTQVMLTGTSNTR